MKNFLLGASVFALLSFGAVKSELLTIKPATPKSTVVFYKNWGEESKTIETINNYTRKGYIFKGTIETDTRALIVMEKY